MPMEETNSIIQSEQKPAKLKKKKKHIARNIILSIVAVLIIGIGFFIFAAANSESIDERYDKLVTKARQYVSEMKYEKAIAKYEKAIEIKPATITAYKEIAEVFVTVEDYNSALDYLQLALPHAADADEYAEIASRYNEINNAYNLDRTLEEWYVTNDSYTATSTIIDGGIRYEGENFVVTAYHNGDIYLTISDTSVCDSYTVNTHPEGSIEYEWKINVECSMGDFSVFARHISDTSAGSQSMNTRDFQSAMAIYTLGNEQVVGYCDFLYTAETAGWGISTIQNLPVDQVTITSCTVEIIDSKNNLSTTRHYTVK